jgi:hypothetical protein
MRLENNTSTSNSYRLFIQIIKTLDVTLSCIVFENANKSSKFRKKLLLSTECLLPNSVK